MPAFRFGVAAALRSARRTSLSRSVPDAAVSCIWHGTMFSSIVPVDYYAGNFRQNDTSRPCLQMNVAVGNCMGTPYSLVPQAAEDLFHWIGREIDSLRHRWDGLPPERRVAMAACLLGTFAGHFIKVHPFINGNGRTSRLLLAWGMMYFGFRPPLRVNIRPPGSTYSEIMAKAMEGNYLPLQQFLLQCMACDCGLTR